MNFLIITTCYPPDTAIAAVRPYMLAKYLSRRGHQVTVLRSGLIQHSADRSYPKLDGVRVITFLGENSMAERFEHSEEAFFKHSPQSGESRISFLPDWIRQPLAKVYHVITAPYDYYYWENIKYRQERFEPMKKALNQLRDEHFDVVFATYGDADNIFGGEYAAKLFGAKWVMDFRDPIEPHSPNAFGLPFVKRIQRDAVRKSDICTAVSDDLAKHLSDEAGGKKVYTLYNGFEPEQKSGAETAPEQGVFTLCYTGTTYPGKSDFSPLLRAIQELAQNGRISLERVKLHYAGPSFDYLLQQAQKCQVADILVDHGYVSRSEAAQIQEKADIFTVLSWNTQKEKGVLTGKFYEGVRANKPILSIVSGAVPCSELNTLNEKFQYGCCYEESRGEETFAQLCDFLEQAYQEKMAYGRVQYETKPELEAAFRYDNLAARLEELCQQS